MRIAFFGSPAAALPCLERLLEAGHSVVLVITQPDKPAGRGLAAVPSPVKKFALSRDLPVIEPARIRKDETLPERIRAFGPDIGIVVAYGQIIPASILYLPPLKTLNVHFSLLPKYRGAAPVQWAILNGERTTGVTIMELNERMDEGGVLRTVETDILPGETASDLEKRLADMGAGLLLDTLQRLDGLKSVAQDHSRATYAPKLSKDDARLAWSDPSDAVERKVRAFTSRPGAFAFFKGRRLIILKGQAEPPSAGPDTAGSAPGTVVSCSRKGISVACGMGTVFTIAAVKPEGKSAMEAHAFALGARIKGGEIFE